MGYVRNVLGFRATARGCRVYPQVDLSKKMFSCGEKGRMWGPLTDILFIGLDPNKSDEVKSQGGIEIS